MPMVTYPLVEEFQAAVLKDLIARGGAS